jgi:nucleotide-binding universal stress UspA family protein
MYKKMLVVLDGSKLAEVVFSYAQEIAGRLNLCLDLLHVCSVKETDQLPMRQAYIESMAEILQKKLELIHSQSGENVACAVAQGHVAVGYPAEEILKYIDANNIDLLMLSTHGSSGITRWNIGSVANQVIHAAKIPVWIVPSELNEAVIYDKIPKRTIIVPLDGSKIPEGVIPYAVSIAKQRDAESEIVVIYAVNYSEAARSLAELEQAKQRSLDIQKYLDGVVQKIKDTGISARSEILTGDPAFAIIDYMKDNPPQLIAMAVPRSGLIKMVFGSVTENVLQMIKKTPLLLVKPEE